MAFYLFNHMLLLFSHSVVSTSLQPRGLQHTRLPCPSLTPRACSNSCLLSWWCHPTISPSVLPFSSCLQSFPASGSFPMSQLFALGGQSTGASALVHMCNCWLYDPVSVICKLHEGRTHLFCSQLSSQCLEQSSKPQPSFIKYWSKWRGGWIDGWMGEW